MLLKLLGGVTIIMKELHSIKPFRKNTNLGIIRLNKLATPDSEKMTIKIGDKVVYPKGFDTYGHPVISESNFAYYLAQKENTERRGESFVPSVEYVERQFCYKREIYDSAENLEKAISLPTEDADKDTASKEELQKRATLQKSALKNLKEILENRKKAVFCKKIKLNTFVLYNKYVLAEDGRIYEYLSEETYECDVVQIENPEKLVIGKELHLPGEADTCDVCGKGFYIEDIKNGEVSENEKCLKVHKKCLHDFIEATQQQQASHIIDAVYNGRPPVEILTCFDEEEKEVVTWFEYKTNQGTIAIRFKRKVIVIKWYDNFKPFNMSIFEGERVTKFDRGIHAWSKDDAIRYLGMAKKA